MNKKNRTGSPAGAGTEGRPARAGAWAGILCAAALAAVGPAKALSIGRPEEKAEEAAPAAKPAPAAAALAASAAAGSRRPEPLPYYGKIAQKVARILPSSHLSQHPLDDEISCKAWTNLITSFDFDHSFFLKSDVEAFKKMERGIDDELKSGEVRFPYEVYRVFRTRLEERYAFVTNRLARPFSFDREEFYTWKRKDAPWPADAAEQDELWRKRIKNELLAQRIAREIDRINATNRPPAAAAAAGDGATNGVAAAAAAGDGATNGVAGAAAAAGDGATNGVAAEAATAAGNGVTNAFAAAAGGAGVASTNAAAAAAPSPEELIEKRYRQLLFVVQDMDGEAILQRYLSAVAMAYDPHSDYMSPIRKEDFDIDMNLVLCGIGAQLRAEDGMVKVLNVLPGGPAARDKRPIRLVKGDKIIGVGPRAGEIEDIVHVPLDKVVRKIRGKKGTRVVLNVIPASDPGGASTKLVDLVRDEVRLEEQAATGHVARVRAPGGGGERAFGVVRLPTFYGTMDRRPGQKGFRSAALDVAKQIAAFNSENVSGMVLDLRNNGGGSLREAILLVGLFVRSGPAVQVREPRQIMVCPVDSAAMAFRKPVVVLINRASASASEIVAGALQDYGRALVIGDLQSHGKGTVQTVLSLGNEKYGSVKVTTASFYRISGSSTQLRGVRSDIVIPSTLEALEIGEDKLPGALPWTQVEPALYIPVGTPSAFLPKLREHCAARLAKDPRYAKLRRLTKHLDELNKQAEVPLELGARRKLMLAENEMRRLQLDGEGAGEGDGGGDDEDDDDAAGAPAADEKDDVVLSEALNVLAEWVEESGGGDVPMETEGDLRTRMMHIFGKGF